MRDITYVFETSNVRFETESLNVNCNIIRPFYMLKCMNFSFSKGGSKNFIFLFLLTCKTIRTMTNIMTMIRRAIVNRALMLLGSQFLARLAESAHSTTGQSEYV